MFLEEYFVARLHDEIIKIGLLGLAAVIVVLAETEVAICEVARAGINKRSVDVGASRIGTCHLNSEGMLLSVLDTDASNGCF